MSDTVLSTNTTGELGSLIKPSGSEKCTSCGNVFSSEKICCTFIINDPVIFANEDNIARLPKEKLLNPFNFILTEEENPNPADKSDPIGIKKMTKDMLDLPGTDCVYGVTSKMLSENELLITLPYDDSNMNIELRQNMSFIEDTDFQSTNLVDDSNIVVLEENLEKTKMLNCNSSNPTSNILSVFSLNNNQEEKSTADHPTQRSVIIEEIHFSDTENESCVKTLTVLNDVEINVRNDPKETNGFIADLPHHMGESHSECIAVEKRFQECHEDPNMMELDKQQEKTIAQEKPLLPSKPTVSFTNKKLRKPCYTQSKRKSKTAGYKKPKRKSKTISKTSRNILDLLANPPKEYIKQNSVVRTYGHKKKTINDVNEKSEQKLYQKIQPPPKPDLVEKVPDKFAVFDFYDEEDDDPKLKEQKLTVFLLRERTCMYCNELFKDPMDVLRHKREAHQHRKIELSREEIEPYLHLEDRAHCPLCFKLIHARGYKSFYIKHLMIHCKNSDFSCRVCGIKFKREDHMLNHEKRHVVLPEATK